MMKTADGGSTALRRGSEEQATARMEAKSEGERWRKIGSEEEDGCCLSQIRIGGRVVRRLVGWRGEGATRRRGERRRGGQERKRVALRRIRTRVGNPHGASLALRVVVGLPCGDWPGGSLKAARLSARIIEDRRRESSVAETVTQCRVRARAFRNTHTHRHTEVTQGARLNAHPWLAGQSQTQYNNERAFYNRHRRLLDSTHTHTQTRV